MYVPKINEMTLREQYATQFFITHRSSFDAAQKAEEDEILLLKTDFDSFIVAQEYTTAESIPDKGTAEWALFRNESNSIRSELNAAAEYGMHGEPPYRIDYEKGVYIIRLLTSIVRVTQRAVVTQFLSLAKSKSAHFEKTHKYLEDNLDKLPPALEMCVKNQDRFFNAAMSTVTHSLNRYMQDTNDMYEEVVKVVERANARALAAPD